MLPFDLAEVVDILVPREVTHIGFVAVNLAGNYLVTEPHGHPSGTSATFNKTRIHWQKGDTPSLALDRCLEEQIGEPTMSIYPIPTVWATTQSTGFYFAGLLDNRGELHLL